MILKIILISTILQLLCYNLATSKQSADTIKHRQNKQNAPNLFLSLPQPEYLNYGESLTNLTEDLVFTQGTNNYVAPVNNITFNSQIQIELNTTEVKEYDVIEVKVSGVTKPAVDDVIALYTPNATVTIQNKIPQKYKLAISDEGYNASGAGTYTFSVVNNLDDFFFVFIRNGSGKSNVTAAAISANVTQTDKMAPTQVHLGINGNYTQIVVQWTARSIGEPAVLVGTSPGDYSKKLTNVTYNTYNPEDFCYFPANSTGWINPGFFIRGLLTGLQADTKYYYKVGDDQFGYSGERSFTTLPKPGANSTLNMIAVADQGEGEIDGSYNTLNYLQSVPITNQYTEESRKDDYRLMLIDGDISYARGYVGAWNRFFQQQSEIFGTLPVMTAIGNHERKAPDSGDIWNSGNDSGGECGIAAERRLYNPFKGDGKYWYSYNVGPVHFLVITAELNFTIGSEQWRFAFSDLQAVNRTLTPWVIAIVHRPMYISSYQYSNSDSHQNVANLLQINFSDLFYFFEVDFTWHGHYHAYMRTCPVYQRQCKGYDKNGAALAPISVTFGNAGAQLYQFIQEPQPEYFEKVAVEYGWTKVFITGTSYRQIAIRSVDGTVIDDFTVKKDPNFGKQYTARYNNYPNH